MRTSVRAERDYGPTAQLISALLHVHIYMCIDDFYTFINRRVCLIGLSTQRP